MQYNAAFLIMHTSQLYQQPELWGRTQYRRGTNRNEEQVTITAD